MKALKYFLGLAFFITAIAGCKKDTYTDVAFVETATAPDKLAALFDITQDNSGIVTITPNAEGTVYYDVYFGDGTVAPVRVLQGKNTKHKYAEGVFNVKMVSYNIAGKTTEITQKLTVSFRAPENLEFTASVDLSNNFKVNVTAKALYETVFRVYFGDVPNEVPKSFLEGETISHTYATTGTYNIRVVALSGGVASIQLQKPITIVDPVLLPVTFESTTVNYAFNNFDGGNLSVISNPQSGGLNTSSKVARMVKSAGQPWGGSVMPLSAPIDFSTNKYFRMMVYSPRVGAKVLLKVENATDNTINFEREVATTVANGWEDLSFNFTAIDASKSYQNIVLIFDLGTQGDGSANFTFLLDNIRLSGAPLPTGIALPLNYETPGLTYNYTNFDGGGTTIIDNPRIGGINTSAKVGQMIKSAGQPWGGSWIALTNPINFATTKTFKVKVYSPRIGAKLLFKVENLTDGAISFEREVATTKANEWEELTFNFSSIDVSKSYQKIVMIFDLGTQGDGSANYTFLFDDITLN